MVFDRPRRPRSPRSYRASAWAHSTRTRVALNEDTLIGPHPAEHPGWGGLLRNDVLDDSHFDARNNPRHAPLLFEMSSTQSRPAPRRTDHDFSSGLGGAARFLSDQIAEDPHRPFDAKHRLRQAVSLRVELGQHLLARVVLTLELFEALLRWLRHLFPLVQ